MVVFLLLISRLPVMTNFDREWSAVVRANEFPVPCSKAHAEDHLNPHLCVVAKYAW